MEHDRDEATPVVASTSGITSTRPASSPTDPRSAAGGSAPARASAVDADQGTWPPLLAGLIAALAAFVLSAIAFAVPVFALWLTAPEVGSGWDTWQEVAAITATTWLAGQGLPVVISGLTVSLLPWGLAVVPALLLFLAGRWSSRVAAATRPVHLATATLAAMIVYAGLAVGVAVWTDDPAAGLGRVIVTTGVLSFVAFGGGAMTGARLTSTVAALVPGWLRRVVAAALVSVGVLVAAAAAAVGVSLLVHAEQTHRLLMSLAPDAAGFVAIVLLSLGYLPVLIGWAVSYLLGIGFTVSSGVTISPFATVDEVTLPVFPLLGALPQSPPAGAAALPIIGLIAGVLGGYTLKRRGARGWSLLGEAFAMIAVATAVLWALLAASSGSLGSGLLAETGPIVGPALGVAALLWGVGSLIIVIPVLAAGPSGEGPAVHEEPAMPVDGFGAHDQQEGRRYGERHP